MARMNRIKITTSGVAHYHLMSRCNNKCFLFRSAKVKTQMVEMLNRCAKFSGIEILSYAIMDNHFHIVAKVVRSREPVSPEQLLRRVAVLRGEAFANKMKEQWDKLERMGNTSELTELQDALRTRMSDISEFMKTFKESFNIYYKKNYEYCGSIWSGRFTSTLIENGEYLERCIKYVLYNPIRARIAKRAFQYKWAWAASGYVGSVPKDTDVIPGNGAECVPEGEWWLLKRMAQIASGAIFGSERFVDGMIEAFRDKLKVRNTNAHTVGEIGYSTHGWKLSKKDVA